MKLGFHQSRNTAKQVLHSATEYRHTVGLQLADVDHQIRLGDRMDNLEGAAQLPVRTGDLSVGDVEIQLRAAFPRGLLHPADSVDSLERLHRIQSPGAVCYAHVCDAAPFKMPYNCRDQLRMRRRRRLRRTLHHEIRFDGDPHPRTQQSVQSQQGKMPIYNRLNSVGLIAVQMQRTDWRVRAYHKDRRNFSIRSSASIRFFVDAA